MHTAAVISIAVVLAISIGGGTYALLLNGDINAPASTGRIDLDRGLVGWWKLDGDLKDATPYANDGTGSNVTPTVDRTGTANSAYDFTGASDSYVSIPVGTAQQPTAQITLSLWAKVDGNGANPPRAIIVSKNSSYIDACFSGKVLFSLMLTTGQKLITGGSCGAVGSWHHYAATYDGSTARLYEDGQQVASGAYTDPVAENATPLYIGRYNGGGYTLNGAADDVRLYNRALSADEVTALYSRSQASLNLAQGKSGLVGQWPLDGNAKDATPYGDDGAIAGSGVTSVTDRFGNANSAFAFAVSGNNSITAPLKAATYPGLTMSAWIKPTAYPAEKSTIIEGILPNSYYLSLSSDGTIATYWYGRSPTGYFYSGSTAAPLNQWSLVTAVWDGSSAKVYVNGELKSTTATAGTGYVPTQLKIGQEMPGSRQFVGSIDDVRVYNQAVSADDVMALYRASNSKIGVGGSGGEVNLSKGLIGSWNLNGNAKDSTPYGHNGTVAGSPTLATGIDGTTDSAYSFDGGDYLDLGTSPLTGSSPFTLAAWIKTSQLSNYSGALTIGPSASGQSAYIGTVATAQHGGGSSIGGGFYGTNIGSGVQAINQWVHVALTFSGGTGGTATIYVDGVAKTSTTYTPNLTAGPMRIGRIGTDTQYDFYGLIDNVRLYNRSLNTAEVQTLYNLQL
jgi:hypothetical protein